MSGGGRPWAGTLGGLAAILAATALALVLSPERHGGERLAERASQARAAALARELTPRVARRVERIRGLEFERIPVPRVVTAERFAEISARVARLGPRARRDLADGEAAARLLGLMAPGEELDALEEGASELAAAAYDTERDRLYVIFDASGESRELLEFLLAHELDHALADQSFEIEEPASLTDDEALAGLALVEGAATATMSEYAARHLNPLALGAAASGIEADSGGVPEFYVEALTWAYLGGAEFVEALRSRAGDWRFVDAGFSGRPPRSTEQVIHPGDYLSDEEPLEVAPARGAGPWRRADAGVLGELTTQQLLRLGMPPRAASLASEGWGGDAYALLARDGGGTDCGDRCAAERALVAEWLMESPGEARELELGLAAYATAGLNGRRDGARWELAPGWAALERRDARVRLALAPQPELAARLADLGGSGA